MKLNAFLAHFEATPPRLVIFRPDDKYNNSFSPPVISHVRAHYDRLPDIGDFEVYRRDQTRSDLITLSAQTPDPGHARHPQDRN